MSDGAELGITAGTALKTVLGGKSEPKQQDISQMESRIRSAPLPGDGEPPFSRENYDSYSAAADSIAHAFLVLADEDIGVLEGENVYTEADLIHQDEQVRESLLGKPKDPADKAWQAMKARWPGADDWIGGASGFMVGFAFNAARTIKGLGPKPNPALATIDIPEEEPT